jgi:hypothetical protein
MKKHSPTGKVHRLVVSIPVNIADDLDPETDEMLISCIATDIACLVSEGKPRLYGDRAYGFDEAGDVTVYTRAGFIADFNEGKLEPEVEEEVQA